MLTRIFMVLLLLCNFAHSGFAQSQKWQDNSYAFSKIKRVLVLAPDFYNVEADEMTKKNLRQIYLAELALKNVTVVQEKEILDIIAAREGKSIDQLAEEDSVNLYEMFSEQAKKQADVIIYAYISRYEVGSRHIPEQTTTKTEYEEIIVKDSKGHQSTVRYPVTRTEVVPAKDIMTLTASVMFRVVDAQTGKEVLLYEDQRYREPNVFEEHTPVKIYERIVRKFFQDFSKLIK